MRREGGYGLASRDAQARVVAEAEPTAKTCALSTNRGLSSLASESRPLIFGSDLSDVEGAEPVVTRSVVAQVTAHQRNTKRWDARARQSWSAGAPSVER